MKNIQVLERFALKLTIFAGLSAAARHRDFWHQLSTLLYVAALLNVGVALARRERPTAPTLTYWDEAVLALMAGLLIRILN
ncbi:hypothetical protein [Methylobacterium isbiliense]|uniref:Uncharacterized protein n=1 Tax=Methylobacterium isbiliense TaxID=315478 RepID=A0ABQ4SKE4_9HYPH|nr:hypothetical protein [Methylobacterium isbiliense]MDN3627369.1 hypothetical protein [Methylobacterium isbiliense]GJE02363.1 hypothetical protein GMJLKIPL_4310 [Methylobacterium isbiliense]